MQCNKCQGLLFETLAVLGLAILVVGLSRESNTQSLIPKLGMIAFGLVRVMPSSRPNY